MIGWPATIQMLIVAIIAGGGGYTWLYLAGKRLDKKYPPADK